MVMVKHNFHHDNVCWQPIVCVCPAGVESWWSFTCVSMVVGVLVAFWRGARSVLTVVGDVLGVLLMS